MIRHHPDEAMLLAHVAGTLASGLALLVTSHLEGCPRCRAAVRAFEEVGATLLLAESPAELPAGLFDRILAGTESALPPAPASRVTTRPPLPAGMEWPRSLRHAQVSRWWWMGPGVRWARVRLPYDPAASLFMFRIAAGKCLPPHTHSSQELTQVLHGAFDDGRAVFGPGDFDAADGAIHHQPVVLAGGECICLAAVDGRVVFDSALAKWAGAAIGL
ncbi:MAG: ChrR family anti-sigma-E factor [Betaproteobacteria bacterium]